MRAPRSGRGWRLILATGILAAGLAVPAAASADTTPGPGSGGAAVTIDSISVVGKVVAVVRLGVVCDPFDSLDWNTGETVQTTAGAVEFGNVSVLQAQGRKLDSGSVEFGGSAVCDGSTVNRFDVAVPADISPWKNGTAVVNATVFIADVASFQDSDSGSVGPVSAGIKLR